MGDPALMPASARHARLHVLTSLRFFAALHVVFFHCGRVFFKFVGAPRWLENIRACGFASVSFFFVLSGFILTYNYLEPDQQRQQRPLDVRRFWIARLSRIYPIYLLALVLVVVGSLAVFDPATLLSSYDSGLAHLFAVQAWFPTYVMTWNFPGWSISAEMFFYLIFPLAALWLRRDVGRRLILLLLLLAWTVSLGISAIYLLYAQKNDGYWLEVVKCSPAVRLPEFLIGMGLGRIFLYDLDLRVGRRRGRGLVILLTVVGLGGVLLLFSNSPSLPFPMLHDALPAPFFALLIYGCAHADARMLLYRLLSHPVLVTLGDASYSLYILQLPIGILLFVLFGQRVTFNVMAPLFFLVYLAVLLLCSVLAFRLIERPAQKRLRAWLASLTGA